MEAASARDQVVEEELSDQEEVRSFCYSKRSQLKTESLYTRQHLCGSWKSKLM